MLAREGKYNDSLFHRLVPGFMVRDLASRIRPTIYPPMNGI
jgi:cyclophilin family peptidyl-prolyl cis-trans isomerase